MTFSRALWILTVFFILGCSTETKPDADSEELKPVYGGTLVYGKTGVPITLDAAKTTETESSIITDNLFDGLVRQKAGRIAIEPSLAYRWDISEDGKTYTFHLRQNVKFHDGSPFNADAVVYSFERQREGADFEYWRNFNIDQVISSIKTVNDSTVRMQLRQPDATFLNILSLTFLGIVSKESAQQYGNDFAKNPSGTGAFKFVKWEDDGTVVTVANPDYWDGRPYIDSLIFKPMASAADRWNALRDGSLDMMAVPDQADIPDMERTRGITLVKQPGVNICYMAMNMNKKPFDDVRIREAIVYAIDREKLVREVYGRLGRPAKNPIPPMLLGYAEEIRFTPFDPEKSKQLLKDAGYPNGFKAKLWTMPIAREYMPNGQLMAEIIQRDLKAVGIETEIYQAPTWSEHRDRVARGEHELSIFGWIGDAPDPHFFFSPLLSKESASLSSATNIAFYKSDAMSDLIQKGITTFDPVQRSQIYKKACELFNQDLPWFTIAHSVNVLVMKKSLTNFQMHASSTRRFNKTWINP